MSEPKLDAYSPQEISERVRTVGVKKANMDGISMFVLSILAGAFIAFGAVFFTLVIHDSQMSVGLTKLVGGLVFCLGLVLVVVAGAELFTGNNLIVMAYVHKEITLYKLLRNWTIVYLGNLVGALSMVMWIYFTRQWAGNDYLIGAKALMIANAKVNLPFMVALSRGVMCNVLVCLVCLAVWLCSSGRSVTDKILAILFPITAFVALGFEHSIANMYFVPMGIILKSVPAVVGAAKVSSASLANLTWPAFWIKNLVPVTIGNIIGGGVLVAAVYWFIYQRKK
ncbi:MAG: formate/nitrite transporter family protein [Omnitrophica bacterium]|nr:formate/nitrite transporter family protein [Candidatus Omnitrophota bacterium]